jgi:hypothetical protein
MKRQMHHVQAHWLSGRRTITLSKMLDRLLILRRSAMDHRKPRQGIAEDCAPTIGSAHENLVGEILRPVRRHW